MKRIGKILLILLTYSPIATVAVAAKAKAAEIDADLQGQKLRQSLKEARARILPMYQVYSNMDDVRQRYTEQTGLQGSEMDEALARDLGTLSDAGLIQVNAAGVGAGPSEHAI